MREQWKGMFRNIQLIFAFIIVQIKLYKKYFYACGFVTNEIHSSRPISNEPCHASFLFYLIVQVVKFFHICGLKIELPEKILYANDCIPLSPYFQFVCFIHKKCLHIFTKQQWGIRKINGLNYSDKLGVNFLWYGSWVLNVRSICNTLCAYRLYLVAG